MIQLLQKLVVRYTPFLFWPVTAFIGFIGYNLESILSDKYTPPLKSIPEQRVEREINQGDEVQSIKEHKLVSKSLLEKNLPPSLKTPDPRVKK